jgi:hypothetical protein
MNTQSIVHISTELIVLSSITFFFMKKNKENEKKIEELQHRVNKQDNQSKSIENHINSLYQMIDALSDSSNVKKEPISVPVTNLRNRFFKQKISITEDDDDDDHSQSHSHSHSRDNNSIEKSHVKQSSNFKQPSIFPMEAIFGLMSSLNSSSPPKQFDNHEPVKAEFLNDKILQDDENEDDIKDELNLLLNEKK